MAHTGTPPAPQSNSRFKKITVWIEKHPVICTALFGILGTALSQVQTSFPQIWFLGQTKRETQEVEQQRAAIRTVLSDGMTISMSPMVETRIKPEDVVLFFTEFKDEANADVILRTSVKRNVLRTIGSSDLREISIFRSSIEDTVLKNLQNEMAPKGWTINAFSLGEITKH